MPQTPQEFERDLQNLISEALASGIEEQDIVTLLNNALEHLETEAGEADDANGGD